MSNADWWAKKLGTPQPQQTTRPNALLPMPPSQTPLAPMPHFDQQPSSKAQSASQTERCPECGSDKYMSVDNAAKRCFDCGYPISQSGSRYGALTGAHVDGAAKTAVGNNNVNNWNPQKMEIIGRIN